MVSNNTTQETKSLQTNVNNTPLMLATSYNSSQTAVHNYTHQATFKVGQDDMHRVQNEEIDNCERNYHILEQPIVDNDYEELDKYEKSGRSQQEEKDASYTTEGPAKEGKGPEGRVNINGSRGTW